MPDEPGAGTAVVVFDIDDTLYLERDYVASGFAAVDRLVADRFGVTGFGALAWRLFLDGRRGDIFDRALAALGITDAPAELAALVHGYRTHSPAITLLPDAAAVLGDLRRHGFGVGVLTDGPAASQDAKVRALGLDRLTTAIVLTDRYGTGYGKPHPRGFAEIAAGTGADRLVYVGDNPAKDFVAPRRLGWTTVRVRRAGGLHHDRPDGADVDHTITDLRLLHTILGTDGPT